MKDPADQLLAEKVLPEYKGVRAELKIYGAPPHSMDKCDAELTSLSPDIGEHTAHKLLST